MRVSILYKAITDHLAAQAHTGNAPGFAEDVSYLADRRIVHPQDQE